MRLKIEQDITLKISKFSSSGNWNDFKSYYGALKDFILSNVKLLDNKSILDVFAAEGISCSLFLKYSSCKSLTLNELNPDLLTDLHNNFDNETRIKYISNLQIDDLDLSSYDLLYLKMNSCTALQIQRQLILKNFLLDLDFHPNIVGFVLTDCAQYGLSKYGGRNFQAYLQMFGTPISSVEEYFQQFGVWFHNNFNWHLQSVFMGRSASVCYFSKIKQSNLKIVRSTPIEMREVRGFGI